MAATAQQFVKAKLSLYHPVSLIHSRWYSLHYKSWFWSCWCFFDFLSDTTGFMFAVLDAKGSLTLCRPCDEWCFLFGSRGAHSSRRNTNAVASFHTFNKWVMPSWLRWAQPKKKKKKIHWDERQAGCWCKVMMSHKCLNSPFPAEETSQCFMKGIMNEWTPSWLVGGRLHHLRRMTFCFS